MREKPEIITRINLYVGDKFRQNLYNSGKPENAYTE